MCGTSEWSSISHRRIAKVLIACARCPKPKFASKSLEKDIEVQKLNIRPGQDANLLPDLVRAVSFIESGVNEGKNVLISSLDGRSRSAAIVAAYLIKSQNLSVPKALELLRNKRPIVEISENVIRQLELYSTQLRAPRS
jgi:protein-tyrosine phosphatase